MTIDIQGIPPRGALRARIVREMEEILGRLRVGKVPARVTFEDENGPKGGPDIRCTLAVRMPRRAEVVVERVAETPRLAFDAAFASLKRQIERRRGGGRTKARRPKKYYVAKRLLEGGLGAA